MVKNVKRKKTIKKNKLGKAMKVAMPFFAIMGGNALASTRNQSASLRTRRSTQNTLVYVSDSSDRQKLPNLSHEIQEKHTSSSPFSVFSKNKKLDNSKKAIVNRKVLKFLSNNSFLNPKEIIKAKLSGDILGRKLFSHNLPFTLASGSTYIQSCVNTQYSQFSYSNLFNMNVNVNSSIIVNTSTGTLGLTTTMTTFSTTTTTTTILNCALNNGTSVQNGADIAACQALHNTCEQANSPPVINSTAVTTVVENSLYSYTFSVSDVDAGDTLTLSAVTLPTWLTFNAVSGLLSGIPTSLDIGVHNVVLRVNDGAVDVDQSFTVTVQAISIFKNGFEL